MTQQRSEPAVRASRLERLVGGIFSWLSARKSNRERHIENSYFKGYRRLAETASDVVGEHCFNCRHEVAYVTWHCDLGAGFKDQACRWERCFVADELTTADLRAGQKIVGGWIGLPDKSPNAPVEGRD